MLIEDYKELFRQRLAEGEVVQFKKPDQKPSAQTNHAFKPTGQAAPQKPKATPAPKQSKLTSFLKGAGKITAGALAGYGVQRGVESVTDKPAIKAELQNKDAKAAALRAAPEATSWSAANVTMDILNKVKPAKIVSGGLKTLGVIGATETSANYLDTKAKKKPELQGAARVLSPTLRGAGYGYGVAKGPGAVVGAGLGLIKGASDQAGVDYKSASDESRARQRERGIARFGFNPYERLDAEVEAEKKKKAAATATQKPVAQQSQSAMDRVRAKEQLSQRLQSKPGVGVLKQPPK